MSIQSEAEEVFSIFKKELQLFSKDKDSYLKNDLTRFMKEVFYLHIENIASNLPEWFATLIKNDETNIIDIYDFCNSFIDDLFIIFINAYKQNIQKEEFNELEKICICGLMLFNASFLFNKTVKKNIDFIIESKDIIINKAINEACEIKEKEIITNMNSILVYLKEIGIKSYSEYNNLLCEELVINETFVMVN